MSAIGGAGIPNFNTSSGLSDGSLATVRDGESTLADVAKRLNVGVDALHQANPQLPDVNSLKVGQDIHLPQGPQAQDATTSGQSSEPPQHSTASPFQLGDPMLKTVLQMKLNQGIPTPTLHLPGTNVMYADGVKGTLPKVNPQGGPSLSPDIAALLAKGAKTKEAKDEFGAAQQAIGSGDYAKAYESLKQLLIHQGEDVLPEEDVKSTETARDQLEFLSKMQAAGVKADYPPTEGQLVDYFKTLKNNPNAAREAFDSYTQNFHVHPVNVKGADFDIKYSQDKVKYGASQSEYTVDVPKDWSSVANRPVTDKGYPQYIGKQMNDCQGFAFMAQKLMGAAGFKLEHHIAVYPGPHGAGHSMAMFTHPPETGYTVTSNDRSFHGDKTKDVAKQGYEYAAGKENVTNKEHFYTGKTMAEAEIQQVVKNDEL